jgi:hypothetical protein
LPDHQPGLSRTRENGAIKMTTEIQEEQVGTDSASARTFTRHCRGDDKDRLGDTQRSFAAKNRTPQKNKLATVKSLG